jgi:hypothetical protein
MLATPLAFALSLTMAKFVNLFVASREDLSIFERDILLVTRRVAEYSLPRGSNFRYFRVLLTNELLLNTIVGFKVVFPFLH